MYFQIEHVLKQYDLNIRQTYKGRGVLICDTPEALFALKESERSKEKAEFLWKIGEYLNAREMLTDRPVRNREGELLTKGVDGIYYMMHTWYRGRECDVKNRMDVMLAVSHLAEFHNLGKPKEEVADLLKNEERQGVEELQGAEVLQRSEERQGAEVLQGIEDRQGTKVLQGIENRQGSEVQQGTEKRQGLEARQGSEETLTSIVSRRNRELKRIRNYISRKKRKNEFERAYLSNFSGFYQQAEAVQEQLQDRLPLEAGYEPGICHGDFNQHNILFVNGNPVMVHFEKCRIGNQITDFEQFFRKIMEKNNWEEPFGMQMIDIYERTCPMSESQRSHFYSRLSYPEKFWKISNRYISMNKVWNCGQNLEKLNKELQGSAKRQHFLHALEQQWQIG